MSEAAAPRHLEPVPENVADELARLAAQRQHHKDQAAQHEAAAAAIDDQIRRLHGNQGTTIHAGNVDILWKHPNRKFNADAFTAAYPAEVNPFFYETKTVLDRKAIPEKLIVNFMEPGTGDGTIEIK
jgi:hypothetical protein